MLNKLDLIFSGLGPMPWTVNSEIYPLWARSTGNACSAGVNWTFNVLVSLTFLHLAQYLTYYGNVITSQDTIGTPHAFAFTCSILYTLNGAQVRCCVNERWLDKQMH